MEGTLGACEKRDRFQCTLAPPLLDAPPRRVQGPSLHAREEQPRSEQAPRWRAQKGSARQMMAEQVEPLRLLPRRLLRAFSSRVVEGAPRMPRGWQE